MVMKNDYWKSVTGKRIIFFLLIFFVVIINFCSVKIAEFLQIPFFFDTWGTTLGVLTGGLAVGLVGGIIYNLIMMSVWGSSAWVWAFANIWVAIIVTILNRKGWISIKYPGKLFMSGIIVGLTTAVVIIIILFTAWGGVETYVGVLPTYDALLDVTGSKTVAAVGEKFITTPFDQIVSLFLAAIIYSTLPSKFILNRGEK
ncbi:hypothetical protein HN836_01970 [Candidatus Woesearchaeota archaeon]|jgi:hypothetical protein|nr:hypothetical protein [Candidatus Woesearchaeota archaeon]